MSMTSSRVLRYSLVQTRSSAITLIHTCICLAMRLPMDNFIASDLAQSILNYYYFKSSPTRLTIALLECFKSSLIRHGFCLVVVCRLAIIDYQNLISSPSLHYHDFLLLEGSFSVPRCCPSIPIASCHQGMFILLSTHPVSSSFTESTTCVFLS